MNLTNSYNSFLCMRDSARKSERERERSQKMMITMTMMMKNSFNRLTFIEKIFCVMFFKRLQSEPKMKICLIQVPICYFYVISVCKCNVKFLTFQKVIIWQWSWRIQYHSIISSYKASSLIVIFVEFLFYIFRNLNDCTHWENIYM